MSRLPLKRRSATYSVRRTHAVLRPAPVLLLIALGACLPLPIPHNEQITPSAAGLLLFSDGSPVAGAPVALTASVRDTLCVNAVIRRVTDSTGHFGFPATEERKHIFWFTMIESFGHTHYWLCARADDFAGGATYRMRTYISGTVWGDSLACLAWVWREAERVTCNNVAGPRRIVTGGSWRQGSASGTYRVILAEEGVWGTWQFRGFVQWLELSRAGEQVTVRATAELPVGAELQAPWDGPGFAYRNGHWHLMLPSIKPAVWHDHKLLIFELGPPGEVHLAPGS